MSDESAHVDSRRMLWLAPLTIAASVVAVLAVREVAIRVVSSRPRIYAAYAWPSHSRYDPRLPGRDPGFRDDRFFPGLGAYLPEGCGRGSFFVVCS